MSRRLRLLFLAAGLGDLATGLLLLAAPVSTLRLMGVHQLPLEPVYLRFVGAFVAGVGGSYLLAFGPRTGAGGRAAVERTAVEHTVLAVTALQRFVVALFVAGAVATGALEAAWATVALYDGALAVFQTFLLVRTGTAQPASRLATPVPGERPTEGAGPRAPGGSGPRRRFAGEPLEEKSW